MGRLLAFALFSIFEVNIRSGNCVEFNKNLTTVYFSPYVKKAEDGLPIPDQASYVFEDLFTMLELVSTKFSRLVTAGTDVEDVMYVRNHTYHSNSNIRARTAEAAALINRKSGTKLLTTYIGIETRQWNFSQIEETEVMVALEAAEIANSIYSATVEGFYFSQYDDKSLNWANATLHWLRKIRIRTPNMKVGTFQDCDNLSVNKSVTSAGIFKRIWDLQRLIILESDFIVCDNSNTETDANVLKFRSNIHEINKNVEVIGDTYWASEGDKRLHTTENLVFRWTEVNAFATKYNYQMWLNEAIDNPNKKDSIKYTGWWRLKSNDQIRDRLGYIEKITELKRPETNADNRNAATQTSGIYIGSASFFACLILAASGLVWLIRRNKKVLSEVQLTKQEFYEFMFGVQDNRNPHNELYHFVSASAFNQPYDKSLEIDKNRLEILEDIVLGAGQFGCVYKAYLTGDDGKMEVALKTTKRNCPSTALKNLLSEIKILSYLGQHQNIVSICGAYTSEWKRGSLYVATQLCSRGSLKNHLMELGATAKEREVGYYENSNRIIKANMLRWSFEIACGMEYLGQKNVIHADLAARNVLLSHDGTAKITDFGLSRRLYDYANYVKQQQEPLPWRWMAVESLKLMAFSTKSDVWSYGVTLWEIFSLGGHPYPGLSWTVDFVESLENGLRMSRPAYALLETYDVMMGCWKLEPEERPSFTELKALMRTMSTDEDHTSP